LKCLLDGEAYGELTRVGRPELGVKRVDNAARAASIPLASDPRRYSPN
jgi:hypothetical protein